MRRGNQSQFYKMEKQATRMRPKKGHIRATFSPRLCWQIGRLHLNLLLVVSLAKALTFDRAERGRHLADKYGRSHLFLMLFAAVIKPFSPELEIWQESGLEIAIKDELELRDGSIWGLAKTCKKKCQIWRLIWPKSRFNEWTQKANWIVIPLDSYKRLRKGRLNIGAWDEHL